MSHIHMALVIGIIVGAIAMWFLLTYDRMNKAAKIRELRNKNESLTSQVKYLKQTYVLRDAPMVNSIEEEPFCKDTRDKEEQDAVDAFFKWD